MKISKKHLGRELLNCLI